MEFVVVVDHSDEKDHADHNDKYLGSHRVTPFFLERLTREQPSLPSGQSLPVLTHGTFMLRRPWKGSVFVFFVSVREDCEPERRKGLAS